MGIRKKNGFGWLFWAILFLSVNIILDMGSYRDYQDKLNLLGQMLQVDTDLRLDTAVQILNPKKEASAVQGRQALEQYGYGRNYHSRFYLEFFKKCAWTAICSGGFLLFLLLLETIHAKRENSRHEAYFWQLKQHLASFRTEEVNPCPAPVLEMYEAYSSRIGDELERMEDYLSMIREQADKDKESVKRLVTDISHQCKTPVAALDTCFAVLTDPSLTQEEKEEFQKRCKDELDSLEVLLDSLLQISRLETGLIQLEQKKAPIIDTLINAANRVFPKASAKQIEFCFDLGKETESLETVQDQKWLCEALINILDNAVKYSPPESKVTIRMRKFYSFLRIEIEDQGIGVPKQEYHKIFQRFYRGRDKRVHAQSGSGVGLYLAREIIEKHNGTISVKSNFGRGVEHPGSKFVVQLPYLPQNSQDSSC